MEDRPRVGADHHHRAALIRHHVHTKPSLHRHQQAEEQQPPTTRRKALLASTMPTSDYTSTISGGLKLKGGAKTPASKRRARRAKPPKTNQHQNPAAHHKTAKKQATVNPQTKPTSPSQPHPPLATRRPATFSNQAVQAQERVVQARRKRSVDMRRLRGRGYVNPPKNKTHKRHATGNSKKLLTNIRVNYSSTTASNAKAAPKRTSSASRS